MKKLFLIICTMLMLTGIASAQTMAFITNDGLYPADEANRDVVGEMFDKAASIEVDDADALSQFVQTNRTAIKNYATDNGLQISVTYNKKNNIMGVLILQPEGDFNPKSIMERMNDVENLLLDTISNGSEYGLQNLLDDESTICYTYMNKPDGFVAGLWQHSMKFNSDTETFDNNQFIILASVDDKAEYAGKVYNYKK